MPKRLTDAQIAFYRDNGYLYPIELFSAAEARSFLDRYEEFERTHPNEATMAFRAKPHMVFTWLDRMVHEARIVDAIEDVLGHDILCWSTGFFSKEARDPRYISWHQDAYYWGLEPDEVCTAWVAFTDSTLEMGPMEVIPGSHKWPRLEHRDTFAEKNMLSRGQEIAVKVDETKAVPVTLKAGQMSLHHVNIAHGSKPNGSDRRRIGFTIRYASTRVRQIGVRDTALLVRGVDTYRHFDMDERPVVDYGPAEIARRNESLRRAQENLYKGAAQDSKTANFKTLLKQDAAE
jgi:non-haem Fe2+, alpha-ketoglutarate-dependent halogenase